MSNKSVLGVFALILSLLSTGCAMAPNFAASVPPTETVQLTKVYIYSFVDLRAKELGPVLMAEIEKHSMRR